METNSTQQEILLVKNTSFSQRQLFEQDATENRRSLPYAEWLEAACWNGWLEDRRPNSAADPYKVAARIVKTVKSANIEVKAAKKEAVA